MTQVRTAGTFRTWRNPELCKSVAVHLFYTPPRKVLSRKKNVKFALKILWRNHLEKRPPIIASESFYGGMV